MDQKWDGSSTVTLEKGYGSTNNGDDQTSQDALTRPTDRHNIVAITMYLFGITCLLPWNFFTQANDYWMYKFRNASSEDIDPDSKTELQATFSSYLAIASKVPYVLFLLVNTLVANRLHSTTRIQIPLLIMIALFVVTVILAPINTDYNQSAFLVSTLCIVVAINVMCGFLQGAASGIAGSFPKVYMGYNVNGMAIGGVLASFAQIISLIGNSSPITSAIMYFVSAVLILCLTFVMFRIAIKTDFYQYHMGKQLGTNANVVTFSSSTVMTIQIFKKIWVYAVSATTVFWVSLSVLPAVLVLISSTSDTHNMWTGRLFVPLAGFFVFNVCDLGGRVLAGQLPIPAKYKRVTLVLTVLRVVFIPLIMLCNALPRTHLPVVFQNDASFIILIFFFALTNGYLTTVILTQAPKEVQEDYQELAGSQMAFFLGLGLMLGSVTSYGIVKML